MALEDPRGTCPETARHDDTPVVLERLADGFQRLIHGRVDETASVDHHDVCTLVRGRNGITFGPQVSQNALGVHECLRAAQTDETDLRDSLL